MINEVINLGIKGSDLVLRKLKQIQEQKKQFAKPVSFSAKVSGVLKKLFPSTAGVPTPTKEPEQKAEPEKKKQAPSKYDRGREIGGATKEAGQAFAGFEGTKFTQAGIKGLTALGGPVGLVVGEIANNIIDAAVTFRDKVKQAAAIRADTEDARNTAIRYAGKDFAEFIKDSRTDIDRNTQRAIVSGLGAQYGKFSDEFKTAIDKLFSTKIGGKYADIEETTSLAQGNFAALGTDRGFFLQKIFSNLGDVPPSIKQKLTSQLFDLIPESERAVQTDQGIRSVMADFDERNRQAQEKFASGPNIELARGIQSLTDKIDGKLADSITLLTNKINQIANARDPGDYILTELKSALLDLKSAITGAIKSPF